MKTTLHCANAAAERENRNPWSAVVARSRLKKDASIKNQSASDKKEKPQLNSPLAMGAVQSAAADLLASGELTCKPFESKPSA